MQHHRMRFAALSLCVFLAAAACSKPAPSATTAPSTSAAPVATSPAPAPAASATAKPGDGLPCLPLLSVGADKLPSGLVASRIAECRGRCDAGDGYSCFQLSRIYDGVDKRRDEARTIVEKACDAGDGTSCMTLAQLHHQKADVEPDKVAKLVARAAKLLAESCERREPWGCKGLSHLRIVTENGRPPLPEGTTLASEPSVESRCEMSLKWCERGYGVSCVDYTVDCIHDPDEETRFYLKGCDVGYAEACWTASTKETLKPREGELLDKACKLGHGPSCR